MGGRSEITQDEIQWACDEVRKHGGVKPAHRANQDKISYAAFFRRWEKATDAQKQKAQQLIEGVIHATEPAPAPRQVSKGRRIVRRYILTAAQNNTRLHEKVWENLTALAGFYGAEILISRFTYNKSRYGSAAVKPGSTRSSDFDDLWYDERIAPFVQDRRLKLADDLIWCGDVNILPSAARPLTGFEAFTGSASGIFPHAKFAMESVATGKHEPTKFLYTTGCVTQRNYIQKRAGQTAEFHHGYGGLLVEIDAKGVWFVRQLNARDSDGSIYDLDVMALNGEVTEGHRVEGITWGDIHRARIDGEMEGMAWGVDGMLNTLCARYQFLHDVLDMLARGHHDIKNPHAMFQRWVEGSDNVKREMTAVRDFLADVASRDWCQTVVVNSNHHDMIDRWLREEDYRRDPENAVYFLELQLAYYRAIRDRRRPPNLFAYALRELGAPPDIRFLDEDESFVICPEAGGGIECGMHGHLGPNGARGNPRQFAKIGKKSNTGHTHTAGIYDGAYVAGHSSLSDMGYNRGPSSWSQSHIVTYANGKRTIVTCRDGKWRAEA